MTVTRDVIYDLLPDYFAGNVSADTRALVEEFFATDPEFGRMAQRFQQLDREMHRRNDDTAQDVHALDGFHAARTRAQQSLMTRGMALALVLTALFVLAMTFPGDAAHPRNVGLAIAGVCGAAAGLAAMIGGSMAQRSWRARTSRFRRRPHRA